MKHFEITLPQLILVLGSIWLFIAIGIIIKMRRETTRNLKKINDAHKNQQTVLGEDELETLPDLDPIWWEELGIVLGERPYVKLR